MIEFHPIKSCAQTQPFAECSGVDLGGELAPTVVEEIKVGLLKHGLLLFRNQRSLTPEREVAFNQLFAWHEEAQTEFLFGFGAPTVEHRVSGAAQIPAWPQVSVLGNVFLDDYHGIVNTQLEPVLGFTLSAWHADGLHDMFDGMPELTTMFNPPGWPTSGGGATYFTSGVHALDRIEPELLEELRRCSARYIRSPNDELPDENRRVPCGPSYMTDDGTRRIGFAKDPRNPQAGVSDFVLSRQDAEGGGCHPCIRRHPDTGEESLYVTPSKVVYLVDTKSGEMRHDIEASTHLLSRALRPSATPSVRYEHQWQPGDFVAWLNALVLHSASDPSEIEGSRLMHRVRLSAPKKASL
ncbi:MAG: TauD/TfdA family dioxygenase [Pseudomonadota bacterium]